LAIQYIQSQAGEQPSLQDVANAVHMSEFHLQRLFSRWAGVSPKRFLQLLTLEHAKTQLRAHVDVLSTSYSVGLSGSSRLHDLFVNLEALTPGEYKAKGRGIGIDYGFHSSPFGECLVAKTVRGICFLGFVEGNDQELALEDMKSRLPEASYAENSGATRPTVEKVFRSGNSGRESLNLLVRGTNFQVQVWRALLQLSMGQVTSYSAIARWIGKPGASRAVGSAVGSNPISWLIPCHRVLRNDGGIGGYHWGETRKTAVLAWEAAQAS
jgi:AraC family transcriptional regulator of adaptative response/methylated-DNA-[protein]-cysteine methyltransferase